MKLLPAIAGGVVGRMVIRRATSADVPACDRIARQYKDALGFVMRVNLERSAAVERLHVCTIDGTVRGFVEWASPTRGANKGWNVVYHIATERGWEGYGIGRNLLYSVPTPIRLKCPVVIGKWNTPNAANGFYAGAGMRLAGTTQTNGGRPLNVWEMRRLMIWCQGGNAMYPPIARRGMHAYGVRSNYSAFEYPYMVDAPFEPKNWDWRRHYEAVERLRPVFALVRDYGDGFSTTDEMLMQVQAFRDLGILRIGVCPKPGCDITAIPADCVIGVSVPSKLAGYLPPFETLCGRQIHLLGGVPNQWIDLIPKIVGAGAVVASIDGNSHESGAQTGSTWNSVTGKWDGGFKRPISYAWAMTVSLRNIAAYFEQIDAAQASMFAA